MREYRGEVPGCPGGVGAYVLLCVCQCVCVCVCVCASVRVCVLVGAWRLCAWRMNVFVMTGVILALPTGWVRKPRLFSRVDRATRTRTRACVVCVRAQRSPRSTRSPRELRDDVDLTTNVRSRRSPGAPVGVVSGHVTGRCPRPLATVRSVRRAGSVCTAARAWTAGVAVRLDTREPPANDVSSSTQPHGERKCADTGATVPVPWVGQASSSAIQARI